MKPSGMITPHSAGDWRGKPEQNVLSSPLPVASTKLCPLRRDCRWAGLSAQGKTSCGEHPASRSSDRHRL